MVILRQNLYSEPIYDQDGVMIRYNGNKIDDVREVLSNSEIKTLDKILSNNARNMFNDKYNNFIKDYKVKLSDTPKIMEIGIVSNKLSNKNAMIILDCYYPKVPGIFTAEYDMSGNYIRSSYDD